MSGGVWGTVEIFPDTLYVWLYLSYIYSDVNAGLNSSCAWEQSN